MGTSGSKNKHADWTACKLQAVVLATALLASGLGAQAQH